MFLWKIRLKVYAKKNLVIFCVFWLSLLWYVDQFIYLMFCWGFKISTYQRRFNQKIYLGKKCDSYSCLVLLWTRISKKRKNHLLNSHFLFTIKAIFMSVNKKIKLKVMWKYRKSNKLSLKRSKENRYFLSKKCFEK